MKTILVTGDIVLDHHLYGGIKTDPTSHAEPGTRSISHLGGADLSQKMLTAASDAAGKEWDKQKAGYDESNAAHGGGIPWPDSLLKQKPEYAIHGGIEVGNLMQSLPRSLHSYGVWTPHLPDKSSKPGAARVWRAQTHFGYGSEFGSAFAFAKSAGLPVTPDVILFDDGGILFRHEASAMQEEHRRKVSFQDELRALCRKHGIEIDERYVWD